MGAERNSGWAKMSPVRIWAACGGGSGVGISLGLGAMNCAPTKEWNGASDESEGKSRFPAALGMTVPSLIALGRATGEICVIRLGIWGLWELPTTQVTPGRVASSLGARCA